MPRDFRSFTKNYSNNTHQANEQTKGYEEILNKYKNMDQSNLMSNLFAEASKLKQQGKLDANSLNSLREMLSPYLDNSQKEMLNSLIDALNEQM